MKLSFRSLIPVVAVAALVACLLPRSALSSRDEKIRPPKQGASHKTYPLEDFFDTTINFGASFAPDEKAIAFISDRSGVFNIWTVPVTGGSPVQLTHERKNAILFVTWHPKEKLLLYQQDQGGNENYHLFLMDARGKNARDLTPGEGVRATFKGWSRDGSWFLYVSNVRDPRFMDVYRYDMAEGTSKMIFENPGPFLLADFSEDGRTLLLSYFITATDMDMYVYDVETKKLENLSPTEGEVVNEPVDLTRDGRYVYYLTDQGSEFTRCMRMDSKTGESELVLESDWDVIYGGLSKKERYLFTATNEDGSIRIDITDLEKGERLVMPEFPDGEIRSLEMSPSERYMTFYFTGDKRPSDLHVFDLETRHYRRLTESLTGTITPEDLVESSLIRYPTFDGREIPAYVYCPKTRGRGEKLPAIVWVHGGPMGQSRKGYSQLKQYFVNQGYVLLVPNVRGSTGYGKTFHQLDDRDWGGTPLQDVVYGKRFLETLDFVDPDKVTILGGSYGGYMVLAALAFTPEVFAAGVDIVGPSNLFTLMESIPPYWEPYRKYFQREVGDVERDRELLRERSPLFSADRIVRPLFVIQGANDPRVKQRESDTIVESIRARNGIVQYELYGDEGHGLRKRANRIDAYKKVGIFLEKYVKGTGGQADVTP